MMDVEEITSSDSEDEEDDNVQNDSKPEAKKKGWFSSMFQSIAGKANLEIAEKLCESVAASLEGKKLASFTRVSSTVQAAMEEALVRILTPRRSIDILRGFDSEISSSTGCNGRSPCSYFLGIMLLWSRQQ